MSKYSRIGIFFGLLYLLIGIAVTIDEFGISPYAQTGGLGYLFYLLPWSIIFWDWISHENILVMLIATALNTSIFYFVGKGIGSIFFKLKMFFKNVQ